MASGDIAHRPRRQNAQDFELRIVMPAAIKSIANQEGTVVLEARQ